MNRHIYKSKKTIGLILVACLILLGGFSVGYFSLGKVKVGETTNQGANIDKGTVIAYINQERANNGLKPLVENGLLNNSCYNHNADMFNQQYWDHTNPQGKGFDKWITEAGYRYQLCGENTAKGYFDNRALVNAWMGSAGHRANILNTRYTEVGFNVMTGSLNNSYDAISTMHFGLAEQAEVEVRPTEGPAKIENNIQVKQELPKKESKKAKVSVRARLEVNKPLEIKVVGVVVEESILDGLKDNLIYIRDIIINGVKAIGGKYEQ